MKFFVIAAALLATLAGPALADDAMGPTTPNTTAAATVPSAAPSQPSTTVPAALPQSTVPEASAHGMSVPDAPAVAVSPRGGGGCHHEQTVYLTN